MITKSKLDDLANSISAKSGISAPLTITQMQTAIDDLKVSDKVSLNWYDIKQIINEGKDPSWLHVGNQINDKWTNYNNVTYDAPWDIVHYNSNGMYLQWHWLTDEEMTFDAPEAIYYVGEQGLPAGTYYFSIGYTQSQWTTEKHIQFTLANNCDPGDQFVLASISAGSDPTASRTLTVYGKGSTTAKQTATTSNGTSGTELGTFGAGGTQQDLQYYTNGNCNGLAWAINGNHRWSQSAIRQWLNSDAAAGEWWQPRNPWDRPPTYAANRPGFLMGCSAEFKAVLEEVPIITALNTVSGFSDAYETTYDKIFLPVVQQLYTQPVSSTDLPDIEGEAWDYWKEKAEEAGIDGYMAQSSTAANAVRIKYKINNHATFTSWRLRSPYRSSNSVRTVSSNGSISAGNASSVYLVCPVCIIKKSTPSYLIPSNLNWATIKKFSDLASGSATLDVGAQIIDSWVRSDDSTSIDVPWDVVHYDDTGMYLQWHYNLPFSTPFDAQEAVYYVGEDGLAAGTYYIATGSSTGLTAWNNKNIQFTLSSACDPGDQFVLSEPTADPTASRTLTVYGFGDTTAKQTATTSSGTGGTLLGTIADGGATNGNCNSAYWIARGNHRWSQSNIRTWLNSDAAAGKWFTPMNPWDRPPSYVNYPGFLYECSTDFKNAISEVTHKTLLDTISGFTDTYEITTDRIFLPSRQQINYEPKVYDVEGEPWQYYRNLAKEAGLPAYFTTTNAALIKYNFNTTTANGWWLRSPDLAGNSVNCISNNGSSANYSSYTTYRACPACKINLIK